jgi:hypothetical protein
MTKTHKMRRKTPIFRLNASVGVDYSKLTENIEVKEAIIEETISAIKDGITKNKKSTSLFEIADSNCYVELERSEWKSTLENVIQYYIVKEDYDKCVKCRDLIEKL